MSVQRWLETGNIFLNRLTPLGLQHEMLLKAERVTSDRSINRILISMFTISDSIEIRDINMVISIFSFSYVDVEN